MKRNNFIRRIEKHIEDMGYQYAIIDAKTINMLIAFAELEGMLPPKQDNGIPGDLKAYEWED
jgi:hypothetical protein